MGPSQLNLRRGCVQDAEGIARVKVDSWLATYRGIIPDPVLDKLTLESSTRHWRTLLGKQAPDVFVAERQTTIAGYCVFGPSRDTDAHDSTGEIYAIYVHPDSWRRGVGQRLLHHVLNHAMAPRYSRITLWLATGNDRAERFYQALGFESDTTEKEELIGGEPIRHLRFALARGSLSPPQA